ncbi:hypothetical protein MWL51_26435 [Escherichia coli]|nr:hypothetical protein [Escherichia coli]
MSRQLQRLSQQCSGTAAVAAERAYEQKQHEKELAETCSRQRSYNGPTLG